MRIAGYPLKVHVVYGCRILGCHSRARLSRTIIAKWSIRFFASQVKSRTHSALQPNSEGITSTAQRGGCHGLWPLSTLPSPLRLQLTKPLGADARQGLRALHLNRNDCSFSMSCSLLYGFWSEANLFFFRGRKEAMSYHGYPSYTKALGLIFMQSAHCHGVG